MTFKIILLVVLGAVIGLALPMQDLTVLDGLISTALCLLLFGVGLSLGRDRHLFSSMRSLGRVVLVVPVGVAAGSIIGASLAGFVLGLPLNESAAIGAGFGWYSLSAVLISRVYAVEVGALAFLSNVLRELVALAIIPWIAVRFGYLAAVAPGGATAMDVTLPIIAKSTDSKTTLVAFVTGVLLSLAVPVLVPLLIGLGGG